MRMVSAMLGIALVTSGSAAIHLWREVASGRQQIASLRGLLQEQQAQSRSTTPGPSIPVMRQLAFTATSPPASSNGARRPGLEIPDAAAIRKLMASPEALAISRQFRRTLVEEMHPNIGEALGLAPQEAEKLLSLLVTQQERFSAMFDDNSDTGGPAAAKQRAAVLQEQQLANDTELRAALENKFSRWQEYRETLPIQRQMRDLRAAATAGGSPLSDVQVRSLTAALAAEQRILNQRSLDAVSQDRLAEALAQNTPERNQRLLDVAAAHLTPPQHQNYRETLERAAAQEQSILPYLQANQSEGETQGR